MYRYSCCLQGWNCRFVLHCRHWLRGIHIEGAVEDTGNLKFPWELKKEEVGLNWRHPRTSVDFQVGFWFGRRSALECIAGYAVAWSFACVRLHPRGHVPQCPSTPWEALHRTLRACHWKMNVRPYGWWLVSRYTDCQRRVQKGERKVFQFVPDTLGCREAHFQRRRWHFEDSYLLEF